jgi:hypothetical protein
VWPCDILSVWPCACVCVAVPGWHVQVVGPVIHQMEKERQKAPLTWQQSDVPAVKAMQQRQQVGSY